MQTFFAESLADGLARLTPEDAHHLRKALRMQAGDALAVAHAGRRWLATLELQGNDAFARVETELPSGEPRLRVTLYQGLPKGDKMDLIVQKCTELGIHRIVPCLFSRCVARWEGGEKKLQRWQRIAREAATQCGRSTVPQVGDCLPFGQLAQALAQHETALIPWEEAAQGGFREAAAYRDVALVIGPEGGIAPEEIAALPARPVTLGPRILRTETAGMAALTMLLTHAGELG